MGHEMAPKILHPDKPAPPSDSVALDVTRTAEQPNEQAEAGRSEPEEFNRRALLQAAGGLGLAGLLVRYAPLQLDAAQARPAPPAPARHLDMEADRVVLGYGAAGGAA